MWPARRCGGADLFGSRRVSRRLVNITLDNLADVPHRCRSCVFWELDPVAGDRACAAGDPALEKEAWVSDTLLEWGSCGKIAYVDASPAGFVLFAPPAYVPRSVAFPTSPVSADAVLLMTARLLPEFTGGGLGRMLVQAVARDVARRGLKAIEAFGSLDPVGEVAERSERLRDQGAGVDPNAGPGVGHGGDSGTRSGDRGTYRCVLPADYLLAVGFKTVRPHRRFPRLRLDLKTTASWREDVEYALERLLSSMQAPALSRG
jgi:GNAT superfamily N-acetyltransferase